MPHSQQKKIPNRLIQFWHDKTVIPDIYKKARQKNKMITSGMQELFVDDEFMLDFLRDNVFLYEVYMRLNVESIRSDIARLVLLHKYGGIYMDMSIALNKPMYPLIEADAELALLQRDDQERYRKYPEQAHIGAMILAAAPNSEFIACCLKQLVDTIIKGHYNHHILFAATKYTDDTYNAILVKRDSNLTNIQKLSFKILKKDYLKHIRIKGLANSWSKHEQEGIFTPENLYFLQKNYIAPPCSLFAKDT